jgi:hypothetical protein
MDCGRFRRAINYADLNKQTFRSVLGIFYEDIEVAVFIKDTRVNQFLLRLVAGATLVRLDQIDVGELGPADTCIGISCTSESACYRGKSNIP